MIKEQASTYTADVTEPAQAVRRLAVQLMHLAEQIESGEVRPVADGAGAVACMRSGWAIDLQMEFTRVHKRNQYRQSIWDSFPRLAN
jgi:hypothetical protein